MFKALSLFFRDWKNYRGFLSLPTKERQLVFYSERDIYYQYFEGYISHILTHSDIHICYLTSDPHDPILQDTNPRIHAFYINMFLSLVIQYLDAKVLVMTMPDLNSYHINRSKNNINHVYIFHGIGSTHLQYNKLAFHAYDSILCNGPNEILELRKAELVYGFKRKELIECGYYRTEKIYKEYQSICENRTNAGHKLKSILIAPSWHTGNILESCISTIIDVLKESDYNIIIRPHPEYIKRKTHVIKSIEQTISQIKNITLELDMTNRTSILDADVLITDWSAISFEYAFGTERPVLFINTTCKIHNPHYKELDLEPIEFTLRDEIGKSIDLDNVSGIVQILEEFSDNTSYFTNRIVEYRAKYLFNWMNSSEIGGNYLINACK